MSKMPEIIICVGMIASGKTTFARQMAEKGYLIVSHDDLTEMLHGRYTYKPELRNLYLGMIETLVCEATYDGHSVVVDRTHLTVATRKFWVDCADNIGVKIIACQFPAASPEVHAMRRFETDSRGRSYAEWLEVAKHHHEQLMAEPLRWRKEGFEACLKWSYQPVDAEG